MVIPTKTASCKRCWEYTHSCSSWILLYRLHKMTQVFVSIKSKNSTEKHFLWISQAVCISRNRCCMEKNQVQQIEEIKKCGRFLEWAVDGQCDSPGHSATYNTASAIDAETKLSILGLFTRRFETAFFTVDRYVYAWLNFSDFSDKPVNH